MEYLLMELSAKLLAKLLGPGWTSEPGHAWNLITFKSEEGEQHWLVDPANMFFIDLSAHDSITELLFILSTRKITNHTFAHL
jgi:hypothetical protein